MTVLLITSFLLGVSQATPTSTGVNLFRVFRPDHVTMDREEQLLQLAHEKFVICDS